ncbi:hypothetical protein DSCOOX_15040 [Desulfosarcina ovata subsp. ovata]|uniref:Glycosyltransferase 2-like domain-containing protein n=2 Tax=Desulfosarcina ovata TaxID=83564 RepID=A0A5K8A7I4_9BACT|nr:hypothetical protein DSCOOX_15040 [Desulfosarcina ovata subsp. ovata]
MAQTYEIAEVLIVDDGSTDQTAAVAEAYIPNARYPMRVIRQPENLGLAIARNTAVRETSTEFIAALDSDVLPDQKWLEMLVAEMEDDVSGVGGELLEMYQTSLPDKWRAIHMVQHRGPDIIRRPPFLWGCNTLFRKRVIEEAGLYKEYCKTNAEDVKLCETIRDKHILIYTPHAKCKHLRRDTPASLRKNFWKWYYYGCFETPHFKKTIASNIRHFRRIFGLIGNDVADRDLKLAMMSFSMLTYTFMMDWLDWWRFFKQNRCCAVAE